MPEPNLEDLENLTAPHQFALLAHEWDLLDSVVSNGAQNLKNVAKILTRVSIATETYGKELQKIVLENPPTTDIAPMTKLLEMISQFISNLGSAAINLHTGISSHVARAIAPTVAKIDSVRETTRKQNRDFQTRLKAFRSSVDKERPSCLNEWQHFLRAHKAASLIEKEIASQDATTNSSQKIMKLQAKQAELDQKTRLQKFRVRQQFSDFENLVKSKNDVLFREYGPEFYDICGALERAQTQSMRKVVATYTIIPSLVTSYTSALQTCVSEFSSLLPPQKLTSSFVSKGIRTVIAEILSSRSVYRDLDPFLVELPCSAHVIQEGTWNDERNTFVLPRKENLELQDSILSDQCGFLNVLRDNRWVRAFVRVESNELTAPDLGGSLVHLWMCKVQRLTNDEMQKEWCFKIYSTTKPLPLTGQISPPTILTVSASSQMERDKWLFMLENVVDVINAKDVVDDGAIFPVHGNYVNEKEKEVLETVFTDDMSIVRKLSSMNVNGAGGGGGSGGSNSSGVVSKKIDADKLSVSLINLSALEGFRATQHLMRVFIETEVSNCSSETLLFRTDSVTSKMLAIYVRETASAWLHSALFISIGELVLDASDDGKSFEINPSALQPNLTNAEQAALLEWAQIEGNIGQDDKGRPSLISTPTTSSASTAALTLTRVNGTDNNNSNNVNNNQNITLLKVQIKNNLKRLENAVAKILDHLVDSVRYVPRKLRWMLQMVQEVVLDKFPETRWSCVSAFVFLRFLCPTVSTATLWKDTFLPNARRNLLLVTKVLQSIANRSLFTSSSKEGYMNLLNPYMRTELSRVDSFCHSFIWPSPPLRDSCVSDSAAALRQRVSSLSSDFDFLQGAISDVKQDMKRDELWATEELSTPGGTRTPHVKGTFLVNTPTAGGKKYATWSKPTATPQSTLPTSASHSALTTKNSSSPPTTTTTLASQSAVVPKSPSNANIVTSPPWMTRSLNRPYPPPPLPAVPPPASLTPTSSRPRSTSNTVNDLKRPEGSLSSSGVERNPSDSPRDTIKMERENSSETSIVLPVNESDNDLLAKKQTPEEEESVVHNESLMWSEIEPRLGSFPIVEEENSESETSQVRDS